MNFDHSHYLPCLRWKQGEYQAAWRLPAWTKKMFTPLIEIPEIGWDFEEERDKKTIDEHLTDFALKKIYRKWGDSFCFVDLKLIGLSARLENGTHPVRYVFDDLRKVRCSATPVTGLDRDSAFQQEIREILAKDKRGVCLRLSIEEAAKSASTGEIDSLLSTLHITPNNCDLILDLGAPDNFEPLEGFAKAIQAVVNRLPYLKKWRTFSVFGSSFPETMGVMRLGVNIVPRCEWQLYKRLVVNFKRANLRLPTFGDYAISHPNVLKLDMRVVKPSATIRYAIDNSWYIVKGHFVRDEKYGKYEQYRELSRIVLNSGYYCDPGFSWGDDYISKCANGTGKAGSPTMWRQVGTNHHIEKVTQDIASFYASVNTA
ncbi:MAG TPA: beta family protein [Sedimentisphaerales bacterium]|nr:beta family protein [Sedimentisphaerales bacterium]